jgi:prepilin peptidase CpaA
MAMALDTLVLAASVTALAAWLDWRSGRIPNWLTASAAALGLLLRLAPALGSLDLGRALAVLLTALGGALLCSAVPLLLFRKGGIGGGDVKLFAALGLICPPEIGLLAETYSFGVALLLAPAWLLYRGTLLRTLSQTVALASNAFRRRDQRRPLAAGDLAWFRLGPAIFLGTAVAIVHGSLLGS